MCFSDRDQGPAGYPGRHLAVPAVKNDAVKEVMDGFESGAVSTHAIKSGKISAGFTRVIRPAQDENDSGETAAGAPCPQARQHMLGSRHVLPNVRPLGAVPAVRPRKMPPPWWWRIFAASKMGRQEPIPIN